MRKVHVKVTFDLYLQVDEGLDTSEVLHEMDYTFTTPPDMSANIEDSNLIDWEVTDSR